MADTRINVEKIVQWARNVYEAAPYVQTLAIYVAAMDRLASKLQERLDEGVGAAAVANMPQVQLDLERFMGRISYYAGSVELVASGAPVWLDGNGNVVPEADPGAELELEPGDYLTEYVRDPILDGDGWAWAGAALADDKGPEFYARFPDFGEGLRITNQINATGNIWDDAATVEKFFGVLVEIAYEIRETPWGQERAAEIDAIITQAQEAADDAGEFLKGLATGLALPIAGAAALIAVALIVGKARGR